MDAEGGPFVAQNELGYKWERDKTRKQPVKTAKPMHSSRRKLWFWNAAYSCRSPADVRESFCP